MYKFRKALVGLVALAALGGLILASAALAQDGNDKPNAEARSPRWRSEKRERAWAARHTMRSSRDIFYDGRTIVVNTYRGELVSAGGSSLTIKYLDGTTADIQTVGDVKVCAKGNPAASLGDLQAGKPIGIHTATGLPGGDLTVVVQASSRDELKACKELMKSLRDRLPDRGPKPEATSTP